MTLGEMKKKALSMITEYSENEDTLTTDSDIAGKLPHVIDQIQFELAQIKKLPTKVTFNYTTSYVFDLPQDFYKIKKVTCDYEIYDKKIELYTDEKSIDMYYYKYPKKIDENSADSDEIEVDPDCQNAMPYGIVADIMKGDPSDVYKDYANRYVELKNQLSVLTQLYFIDTTNAID